MKEPKNLLYILNKVMYGCIACECVSALLMYLATKYILFFTIYYMGVIEVLLGLFFLKWKGNEDEKKRN